MSRSRRHADAVAPSLFPFLAVLLCTMGSLVLILMLIVSGAQASAKQIATQSRERTEELESQIELAKSSYQSQLDEGRIALEKRRLKLQHFEDHILELLAELEQLEKKNQLLKDESQSSEEQVEQRKRKISELEKQIAEAADQLKQKVDKPDGDKPIFAIIPYEGTHGTHRRPIYLECTAEGIVIQPEGILLSTDDLQPPHGPGNPLDAALRTIRAEFKPENGAVTRTAYPLLVVRPSGILSYSLARNAMSGWDDQFGYELIDEGLELTFPASQAGLSNKITKSISLAKQRQSALVMAMPQRYRPLGGSSQAYSGYGEGEYAGQGGGQADGPASDAGGNYAGDSLSGSRASDLNGELNRSGRGGFSLAGDVQTGESSFTAGGGTAGGGPGDLANAGFPGSNPSGSNAMGSAGNFGEESSRRNGPASGSQQSGSPSADPLSPGSLAAGSVSAGQSDSFFGSGGGSGSAQNNSFNQSAAGSSGGGESYSGQATSGQSSGGQPSGSQSSGSSAASTGSEGKIAMPFSTPTQGQSSRGGGDASSAGQSSTQNSGQAASANSSGGASSESPMDPNADPTAMMPELAMQKNMNRSRERTDPVARERGRGWAWSEGPRTQTPVVRSIHLHCFADRWVLVPDNGNPDQGTVISFDLAPRDRAEKLARAVQARVDSWGLALTGGYWKPVIVVDVAPDAAWRFNQLRQLLDGSGLEIQLRERASR